MNKFGNVITAARKENKKALPAEAPEPEVNLCVRVPASLRRHWAAESKRLGVSMTSVMIDALKAKFGEPK